MSVIGLAATLPGWALAAWWDWQAREVPVGVFAGMMAVGALAHILGGHISDPDVGVALGIATVGGLVLVANLWPAGDVFGALTLGVAGGTLGVWALLFGMLAGVPLALAHRADPDGVPYLVALTIGAATTVLTVGVVPYLA